MQGMLPLDWIGNNWSTILQTVAVTAALVFTGAAFVVDTRARRATNLIRLSERHRDLWERIYTRPELARILDATVDLSRSPVTPKEELFMIFVILHLSDTYYVMKASFFENPGGLRRDIRRFFSLPIPRAVWYTVREMQEEPFARFVEESWPQSESPVDE